MRAGDLESYPLDLERLRTWMGVVGVDRHMIEQTLDFAWSFPRVRFTLADQRLLVPDDQRRPDHERRDAGGACLWDFAFRRSST